MDTPQEATPAPFPIDFGIHKRAVVAQLQADQGRLAELEQERARLIVRIHEARGKLDLLDDLAQQAETVITRGGDSPGVRG